jgi:hypothetical protein
MQPLNSALFERMVSKPRLQSYRGYFHVRTTEEAVGLYMWNCELSAQFWSLLALFEVVLRNGIHHAFSQALGGVDTFHWYDGRHLALKQKTLDSVAKIRFEGGAGLSPDEIVSRTTFGFWPAALKAVPNSKAHIIFPQIFSDHPFSARAAAWSANQDRARQLQSLYDINVFRNRLAHHEPVWKFAHATDRTGRVLLPASTNLATSIDHFKRLLSILDQYYAALSGAFQQDIQKSSWRRRINFLLSDRGVARYRAMKHTASAGKLTPAEFNSAFSLLVKANQPVRVQRGARAGLFIPE